MSFELLAKTANPVGRHRNDLVGASMEDFISWKDGDFRAELARFTDLPVSVVNDATAGCQAEHIYGRGKEFRD